MIPKIIPAKFGARSTMLARGPVLTLPCTVVANVIKITAAIDSQPEKARHIIKIPLTIQPEIFNLSSKFISLF
jgi:hypothetical protein